MQNLRRVGKNSGPIFSHLWTKVHERMGRAGDPLRFSTLVPDCLHRVPFRRYKPLKLPLSCEVVEKRWFVGSRILGKEDTPDFGHAFSNRTHSATCGRFWLSYVQRARTV